MKAIVCVLFVLVALLGVSDGQRGDCPTICPQLFAPTCGFNGDCYRQFSNPCHLSAANCKSSKAFTKAPLQKCNDKRSAC